MRRRRFLLAVLAGTAGVLVPLTALGNATVSAAGQTPPPPTGFTGVDQGGSVGASGPQSTWTAQQRAQFGAKVARYNELMKSGALLPPSGANSVSPMSAPVSAQVAIYSQPQQTSYWCGPASTHNALGTYGVNVAQSSLASEMGTTPSAGTSRDAMLKINNHEGTNAYIWHYLGTPAGDPATGVNDLLTLTRSDIWWGASVIYNVETYGYDPLQGRWRYPLGPYNGYDIRHYYTAYGYYNNGEQIQVYDENNAFNSGNGFWATYYYRDQWAAIHNHPLIDQIEW